jgi:hypothetical protein
MSASRLTPARDHWRASFWVAATRDLESFCTLSKIQALRSHQSFHQTKMIRDFAPLELEGDKAHESLLNHSTTLQSDFQLCGCRRGKATQRLMHAQTWWVKGHSISRWPTVSRLWTQRGRSTHLAIMGATIYPPSKLGFEVPTRWKTCISTAPILAKSRS